MTPIITITFSAHQNFYEFCPKNRGLITLTLSRYLVTHLFLCLLFIRRRAGLDCYSLVHNFNLVFNSAIFSRDGIMSTFTLIFIIIL